MKSKMKFNRKKIRKRLSKKKYNKKIRMRLKKNLLRLRKLSPVVLLLKQFNSLQVRILTKISS
jgi:hypothetical protein